MTTKQIEVAILGQPYRLACSPETEAALLEAVARVDAGNVENPRGQHGARQWTGSR